MDSSSSIEDVTETSKRVKISIPAAEVKSEFESALERLVKSVQLKGFRPGKAPRHMVESLHGPRVKAEVTEKLVGSSLFKVLKDNKIDVIGTPKVDITSGDPIEGIEFTATVDIFPKPVITGYESFAVRVPREEPGDQDVDRVIERLRESKATPRKLEFRTTAQKGDVVESSISVQLEGSEPSRAEPLTFQLGEGRLPPAVEEGLVGAEVGSTREISAAIPEDYRDPSLRGKQATFKVSVLSLSEKIVPELNDDFAKSLEFSVSTLLELRMKARESLIEEANNKAKSEAEAAVLEQLLEKNKFGVPESLVDDEIRSLLLRLGFKEEMLQSDKLPIERFRAEMGEAASKRVRSAIIVDRIAEAENLRAQESDVTERIGDLAKESGFTEEDIRKYLAENDRMLGLMLDITRSKVLRFLLERTKIEYYKAEPAEAPKGEAPEAK